MRSYEIAGQVATVGQSDGAQVFMAVVSTAAFDRFDRLVDPSIGSIDSIDSIIFRFFAKFLKIRSRRDDRFRLKIVKIRAILAIFRPFEDFGDFRFDRFDILFDSIDTELNDRWGPPCFCESRDVFQEQEKWTSKSDSSSSKLAQIAFILKFVGPNINQNELSCDMCAIIDIAES